MPNRDIYWRNNLMGGAGISLCLALLLGLRAPALFASPMATAGTLLVFASGLFVALGIRELAAFRFGLTPVPWYNRPRAMPYLLVMLAAINGVILAVLAVLPQRAVILQAFSPVSLLFTAMATQFFWVAVLDWPRPARQTPDVPIPPDPVDPPPWPDPPDHHPCPGREDLPPRRRPGVKD